MDAPARKRPADSRRLAAEALDIYIWLTYPRPWGSSICFSYIPRLAACAAALAIAATIVAALLPA